MAFSRCTECRNLAAKLTTLKEEANIYVKTFDGETHSTGAYTVEIHLCKECHNDAIRRSAD